MPTREQEVVELLRQDEAVSALVTGGIYAAGDLGVGGITDPITTPDVWPGGVFVPTIIVRQGNPVPGGRLVDLKRQEADYDQRIMVWMYALTLEALEDMRDAVFSLMQGKELQRTWKGEWIETIYVDPPELPPGTKAVHDDFRITAIRRPVAA